MIEFDNETENFELPSKAHLSPVHFITVHITYNGNSKRMNIPHILKIRYIEESSIKLYWVAETEEFYIDFRPNEDDVVPEKVDVTNLALKTTGRGYYITLPSKWFKNIKPNKASLMQLDEKKTVYKVQFYGND